MADLYNRKPILGVRLVEDGETMHNGAPVFGVYEVDSSVSFDDSQYVLGVDVLDTDETMNNMQPVRGVVLIEDGRRMYNNRRVVPAFAVGGSFSQDIIITVGKDPGNDRFGYSDGSFIAAFGSLSGEPVEGHPVIMAVSFISAGYTAFQIVIQGDVVDLLDGKTVWVDGVPYTSTNPGNGWAYQEAIDVTIWQTLEFPALLEEGSQHKIEIKENPWTPAVLFENGEHGGLYDPSDLATLFQDADGTTPAVPGSPVGLVLDKSGNGINLSQPTVAAQPTLQPPGLRFDLADDALTTTLPQAINGDLLIAGTKGSIIEPVSYTAGSTFALGVDTYTGGTPGILRAIGPIVGVVLLDRAFTEDEKTQLIDYYKARGAKGLLVEGPELVVNPGNPFTETTGWTALNSSLSVEDGALRVAKTNTNGQARSSISSSSGGFYKYKATLKGRTTTSTVWFQLGPTAGSSTILDRTVVPGTTPVVSPITVDGVVTSPSSSIHIALYSANTTGQYDDWSEVSIRELRPQEDW